MRPSGVMGLVAATLVLAGTASGATVRVARVVDGDTLVLASGQRVRLVQIDAPETHGQRECYGGRAARTLRTLLPRGTRVRLVRDRRLDDRDAYGRLLRYVFRGGVDVNLRLVARGAATVWFFHGDRGRDAGRLLRAERQARERHLGLWKACPRTRLDVLEPATTGPVPGTPRPPAGRCEPGYSPCLPVVDDLDCAQIADSLKPIHVTGSDPYRLDADGDGLGCER